MIHNTPLRQLTNLRYRSWTFRFDQIPTDIEARCVLYTTTVKHHVITGAAANINVQYPGVVSFGVVSGATASACNHGLQVRSRRRYHEIAQPLCKIQDSVFGVLHLGGFAGDDDGASLNIAESDAG